MWDLNLTVVDAPEANFSLGLAEALGTANRVRPRLTQEQFAPVVALFEEDRERVEYLLSEFDEENQSWRSYAGAVFDWLSEEKVNRALSYLNGGGELQGKTL